MIPILFNKDEKTFTSLGLGQMDATLVEVERERNGNYTLYAEVPFSSPQAKQLTKEMLIKADAGSRTKWQTFKINRTIKDTNANVIKVYADHISMDTINDAMKPKVVIRQQTAEGALRQWANNLVSGKAYDVQSDITYVGSTEWTIDEVENARQALGGVSGSILDVWGGEFEFDNNRIILHKEMGREAPTVLEYGRNIVSLEYEELIDGVYTSIYPYATYTPKSEGNRQQEPVMVTLDELIVDSEYAGNYETRRIQIVDFSNEFDSNAENPEIPTQAKLRTLAKAYVKNNGYGIPKISQEIDFVDLSKTLDYQDIQVMEEIELNDRVPVYYPNIDAETNDVKVTTTNWDVLNNRYSKITLSTIGAMNSNSITSKLSTSIKDLKAEQKKINNTVPYLINAQGNRIWYTTPDDNMEHKIDDTWLKKNGKYTIILKWNGSMWEEVLNDETFIAEIEEKVAKAQGEAEKASQSAKDADTKANSALEKAGANADLLNTHQNTIDTINTVTLPDIASSAGTALSNAKSAMDEAKKADEKIANYVKENGLVNGTTVERIINDPEGTISQRITTLETNKLDSTTYTNFYENDYKRTAQGVTDAWTAVNKIVDENGNTTDTFAKAVYDRNATRRTEDFDEVTKDLVKEATYTAGINGINGSIGTISGQLDKLKAGGGGRNYALKSNAYYYTTDYKVSEYDLAKIPKGTKIKVSVWGALSTNVRTFRVYINNGNGTASGNSQIIDLTKLDGIHGQGVSAPLSKWTAEATLNVDATKILVFGVDDTSSSPKRIEYVKVETGETFTDWTVAPEDMLGKADFQVFKTTYEANDQAIKARLLAVDSGKEGSIAYRLNETEKTASGNTTTISDIKTKPGEQITGYQTIKERSELYERVIGTDEAGIKSNMARMVMTDSLFKTEVIKNVPSAIGGRNYVLKSNAYYYTNNYKVAEYDLSTIPKGTKIKFGLWGGLSSLVRTFGVYVNNSSGLQSRDSQMFELNKLTGVYGQGASVPLDKWTAEVVLNVDAKKILIYGLDNNNTAPKRIEYVQIETGDYYTDWTAAPEDKASVSAITQLENSISLKVSNAELLSQINLQAGGVLITSGTNKLNITPETTYIEDATIKSGMIESLIADKITTGTFDASKAKIINLDANNITTGNLKSINIVNTISYPEGGRTYTGDMTIAGGQISSYVTAGSGYYKSIFLTDRTIRLSNQDATMHMRAGNITFDGTLTGGGQIWYQDNLARLIAGSYNGFALASYRNGSFSNRLSVGGWPGEDLAPFVDVHTTMNMRYNKIENINGLFMKTAEGKTGATMYATSDNNLSLGGTWGTVIGHLGSDGTTVYEFLKADQASDRVRFAKNINMQGNTILNQSDERLKHNIHDLERDDLSILKDIQYKNFTFNNQDKETFGFIAQDIQKIMPSLIMEETDGYLSYDSMEYTHFIGHALQQHVTKVDDEITQLKAQVASLQDELALLKGA